MYLRASLIDETHLAIVTNTPYAGTSDGLVALAPAGSEAAVQRSTCPTLPVTGSQPAAAPWLDASAAHRATPAPTVPTPATIVNTACRLPCMVQTFAGRVSQCLLGGRDCRLPELVMVANLTTNSVTPTSTRNDARASL